MLLRQQFYERGELGVFCMVPIAAIVENFQKPSAIGRQILFQLRDEKIGPQPLEASLELARIETIGLGSTRLECGFIAQIQRFRVLRILVLALRKQFSAGALVIDIFIVVCGVQKPGILRAERQRKVVLDGVQEDVVAKDMALQ